MKFGFVLGHLKFWGVCDLGSKSKQKNQNFLEVNGGMMFL